MKSCLLALPLLVSGAVVLTSACSIGGTVGVAAAVCTGDGDACASSDDCCSATCAVAVGDATGVCATAVSGCLEDDTGPCTDPSQCCSGVCASDGNCGVPACVPDGAACQADGDCCDQEFCDVGACAACVSTDEPCSSDSDCCSGACAPDGNCS